jgi:hypothetical protein
MADCDAAMDTTAELTAWTGTSEGMLVEREVDDMDLSDPAGE